MLLRFIHIVACIQFIHLYCCVACHCIDHKLFIHSPVDEYLGYFQFGANMNKFAVNTQVQVYMNIFLHFS